MAGTAEKGTLARFLSIPEMPTRNRRRRFLSYDVIIAVTNTIINQTGRAIEAVAILMGTYLSLSLSRSMLLKDYNRRMALVRR